MMTYQEVYNKASGIKKPDILLVGFDYIFYVPWAKKGAMKKPKRLRISRIIDIEDGIQCLVGGNYLTAAGELGREIQLSKTTIQKCIFNLTDENICSSLFCKGMLFYRPHQIKPSDQKFINLFTELHPELMI